MAKKYTIKCNQGSTWWTWTHERPISQAKIKKLFKTYAETDAIELPRNRDFTLDFIMGLWDCTIERTTHNKGV